MLLLDLADPVELLGYVREIQDEAEENGPFTLSRYLPNRNIVDIQFEIPNGGSIDDVDVAQVRNWDTEAPLGRRAARVGKLYGELPPISKKMKLGEEQRIRMDMLRRGTNDRLIDRIFDDADALARSIAGRFELFRGEALVRGRLDINENGVVAAIDYGRDPSHTVAPGVLWSATGTSTPISDYQSWVRTYVQTNGFRPGFSLANEVIVDQMLRSQETRGLLADISGTPPQLVTIDALEGLLRALRLPPIVEYETSVRVNGVLTRVIAEDKFIMMPPDGADQLGETLFGVTMEALELAESQAIDEEDIPGMTACVMKTFDPTGIWTLVSAVGLAVVVNPDYTFVADVA